MTVPGSKGSHIGSVFEVFHIADATLDPHTEGVWRLESGLEGPSIGL